MVAHPRCLPAGPQLAGRTEEFIGSWCAKHPDNRAKLVLATKVAGPMPVNFVVANREKTLSGNADENAPLPRLVPDQIRKALAASLVRLQTTYVDLLQLHWCVPSRCCLPRNFSRFAAGRIGTRRCGATTTMTKRPRAATSSSRDRRRSVCRSTTLCAAWASCWQLGKLRYAALL